MKAMIVVLLAGMLTSGCATYNELSSIRRYEERVAREVYETDGEAALDNAYTVRPTRGGQGVEIGVNLWSLDLLWQYRGALAGAIGKDLLYIGGTAIVVDAATGGDVLGWFDSGGGSGPRMQTIIDGDGNQVIYGDGDQSQDRSSTSTITEPSEPEAGGE
jgi:hypothetical protein